jgi:hypothetical protein
MGAIQWLIFCGVAVVIAITLGTACLVVQFCDRALQVAERESTTARCCCRAISTSK